MTAETTENDISNAIKILETSRRQLRTFENQMNLLHTELKTIKDEIDAQNYGTVKILVNLAKIRIEQTIEQEDK
jgi:hypothetical protein